MTPRHGGRAIRGYRNCEGGTMWQYLTQDEAQARLRLLERHEEAGVPDAAGASRGQV